MSKIYVDAFGGDYSPIEQIKGSLSAKDKFGIDVSIVGNKEKIIKSAKDNNIDISNLPIVDAENEIEIHDNPKSILKEKNNCSMAVGLKALSNGECDAFLSSGSTGALLMGATFIVKRIKKVKRPAICTVLPSKDGCFLLLDCGANAECRPEMLHEFAILGSTYAEKVINIENPKIGLLNIGSEETKGTPLQIEAFELLSKDATLNFIGNIEARDIPEGKCDVVVTDGFSGNVVLKLTEGVSLTLMGKIKEIFLKNIKNKIAALIIKKDIYALKKQLDYTEFGGAPIIGVTKPVIKSHGSSNAKAIMNAIKIADNYANSNAIDIMTEIIGKQNEQ